MYLNCHSYFSLNYGVMSVKDLLLHAATNGIEALVLTDINNTSGCIDFLRLASGEKYKIKPIIGIDFRRGAEQLYIGIARNNEGFRQLNDFLSRYRMAHEEIPLLPCEMPDCYIIYPWKRGFSKKLKDNEYIGLKPYDVPAFQLHGKQIPRHKLVILASLTFRDKKDYNTHRLLRAIYHNTLLSRLPSIEPTSEKAVLIARDTLLKVYQDFPEAVKNTLSIIDSCHVDLGFDGNGQDRSKNKRHFYNSKTEDYHHLIKLAEEGLKYRYNNPSAAIKERLRSELETINKLDFPAYFLINHDIISYAASKGYFYIGRGSGANSLVAYCLRITDVDPIELDLYFERFINESRKNPPDFDIDFSHTDRDDIRRYIFDKYGNRAALVGSYNTFEGKSCIRQIGKVFGLPDGEIEALQSERLDVNNLDEYGQLVLKYAPRLHTLPNLLSVHACGILISELPITYYTALELLPVGYPSTQFSMLEAEDVGLYKFDILSQRGLGHIKDAVELVNKRNDEHLDIHNIQAFKEDPRIKQMLRVGDTIGCFYVESPAMRQLLRKLQVEDYLGLVAASSVIRPGVSSSGMMREYILRYRYPERRADAHPRLLEIMPDTYGVMVYQEDVIKVAHYYAGLTLEEADVMRRGMSGKFRSREEFQLVKEKFFTNCIERGYPDAEAAEIWRQIESFAGYSFAKGHSASYAVESYQSLYLRAYHPIEFMVGVLNNFGGFYTTEFYLHEAKMLGAKLELPCINNSDNLAVLEGDTIYMGLCLVKDLEQATVAGILEERYRNGPFIGLFDLSKRVAISLEQLRILIRIKALRFTGKGSKELLWDAHMVFNKSKKTVPHAELFNSEPESQDLPPLEYGMYEDAMNEMQLLGFPYTPPFDLLKTDYKNVVYARDLMQHLGQVVYMTGYYVNIKRVHTITDQVMYFGSFTDGLGYLFDTVHFPQSIERYPFQGKGCYLLKGTVVEDFEVPSLEVSNMMRIPWAFS